LATNSAVRSDRGEQEAIEAALLAVGDEQPGDAELGREQQGHPQNTGREVAADLAALRARSERRRTS
jgi:hypothetical protein